MIAIRTMTEMPKTCEDCRLKQATVTLYGHMLTYEYIRKQDAIDAFNRIKNTLQNPETAHYDTLMFYEIEDVLEDVEPADVAPVVHGRWIKGKYTDDDLRYNDYSYRCNRCGKIVDFEENYCPNCGAKMDAQGEE